MLRCAGPDTITLATNGRRRCMVAWPRDRRKTGDDVPPTRCPVSTGALETLDATANAYDRSPPIEVNGVTVVAGAGVGSQAAARALVSPVQLGALKAWVQIRARRRRQGAPASAAAAEENRGDS
jgi:hypothetical protein